MRRRWHGGPIMEPLQDGYKVPGFSAVDELGSVCSVCYNFDDCLIPTERRSPRFRKGIFWTANPNELSGSADQGCPACLVVWEGVCVHLSRLGDVERAENQIESLEFGIIAGHPLNLMIAFKIGGVDQIDLEFYTRPGMCLLRCLKADCLMLTDDPVKWNAFGMGRNVPATLNARICVENLRRMLLNCIDKHPDCIIKRQVQLPRRLLDVGSFDQGLIKLVETANIDHAKYVTLSHCWGKFHLIRTTKENLKDHLKRIEVEKLPKTFQDAAMITSGLGVQYLWIDSRRYQLLSLFCRECRIYVPEDEHCMPFYLSFAGSC